MTCTLLGLGNREPQGCCSKGAGRSGSSDGNWVGRLARLRPKPGFPACSSKTLLGTGIGVFVAIETYCKGRGDDEK